MRLVLTQLLRIEPLDPREAVLASPALELVEPRELALGHGHDHLAATLVGDPLLRGESEERLPSRGAQPRLARARLVVEAGVDDAAVVAGLVKGQALFGLEHQAAQPMVRRASARAVARPTMPPPTTMTSKSGSPSRSSHIDCGMHFFIAATGRNLLQ